MNDDAFGSMLPRLVSPPPGPASAALARRLATVESPNATRLDPPPIFWAEAAGANVRDVDGNVYVDLTAGFGVAAAGHANPRVAAAVAGQAAALPHGLGDVHPTEVRLRLLERLADVAPGELGVSVLGTTGAEAVEAALKTAVLATGRPGILAFEGAYHGLTYGALAATWRPAFRERFATQLFGGVRFAPFPDAANGGAVAAGETAVALRVAERMVREAEAEGSPIGAVLVEPIQGRGGLIRPAPGFLAGLRRLCDAAGALLIFDEVYTGLGRTGRWFACEHESVLPDLLVVGKALACGLPLSAVVGTSTLMRAWPPSEGEAIHTSTFLGNPVACAAALAHLDEIEEHGLVDLAARSGRRLAERLDAVVQQRDVAVAKRGLGLMQGLVLASPDGSVTPGERTGRVVDYCLRKGVLLLAEGPDGDVLAFTPPLVITEAQMDFAVDVVDRALEDAG